MHECGQKECIDRIAALERENIELQKELAIKSVISEISQLESEQDDPNLSISEYFYY